MKKQVVPKQIWLAVALAALLALLFTVGVLAETASAQTETSALDLISYQVRKDENGTFSLRLITGVDSLNYKYCGYRIRVTVRNEIGNPLTTTMEGRDIHVHSSIFGGQKEYAVSEMSDFSYAFLAMVTGLDATSDYAKVEVSPFVITLEGKREWGRTVTLAYMGEEDDELYPLLTSVSPEELPPRSSVVLDPTMQSQMETYLPTAWAERIPTLNIGDADTFAFAMQSDSHYTVTEKSENAMTCLKALTHYLPLDFIANTGDLIRGYQAYEENTPKNSLASMEELVRRYTEDVNTSVLLGMGNHDTNQVWSKEHGVPSDQMTQADFYNNVVSKLAPINGDYMVTNGESSYYYVDFPYDEIRVIVLNTTDSDYETRFGSLQSISTQQVRWFCDVALDTDYSVLVMTHIPLPAGFPETGNNRPTNSDLILEAVNGFVDNGGDFIAYLCGHTHYQSELVDADGRLHISFRNDPQKAEIVTIDTANRKIVTYGLGSGVEDRQFDY